MSRNDQQQHLHCTSKRAATMLDSAQILHNTSSHTMFVLLMTSVSDKRLAFRLKMLEKYQSTQRHCGRQAARAKIAHR